MTTTAQRLYQIDIYIGDQVILKGKEGTVTEVIGRSKIKVQYEDGSTEEINPSRTVVKGA